MSTSFLRNWKLVFSNEWGKDLDSINSMIKSNTQQVEKMKSILQDTIRIICEKQQSEEEEDMKKKDGNKRKRSNKKKGETKDDVVGDEDEDENNAAELEGDDIVEDEDDDENNGAERKSKKAKMSGTNTDNEKKNQV